MSKPTIQIGHEVREMTDNEFSQWEADNAALEAKKAADLAALDAKKSAVVSAKTKLAALGLTGALAAGGMTRVCSMSVTCTWSYSSAPI